MSDKIEYSRLLMKRSTTAGEVPTVPPVTAVTLNQFTPTDIFEGEFFLNSADDLLWIRTENGILPISLSGTSGTTVVPQLVQVLNEGNYTGGFDIIVNSGDTIVFSGLSTGSTSQFLGIDASGNTIISSVIPGSPDLEDVLTVGNATGPHNISVDIGYKVEGQTGGNWVRPETADGNLEINVDNELTIVGITSGVTDIVLSYDPDTKYVKYQSISGATGTSGTSGTSGSSGTNGSSGTSGTNGSSGSSGTSGTNGSSGSSGTSGTDGTKGDSGTSGTNGSSGTSGVGTNGSSGTSGLSGVNGTNGTSGTNGSSGTNGAAGDAGSSGTNGTSGTSGIGTNGTSGTNGAAGSSGTSGTSGGGGGSIVVTTGTTLYSSGWTYNAPYYEYNVSSADLTVSTKIVDFTPYNSYAFTVLTARIYPYILISGSLNRATIYADYIPSGDIIGDLTIQ